MSLRVEKKQKGKGNRVDVIQINDSLSQEEINAVKELLVDPVAEKYSINEPLRNPNSHEAVLETKPKPGVANPEGRTIQQAVEEIIRRNIGGVVTGKQYIVHEDLDPKNNADVLPYGNPLITDITKINHAEWDPNK